jgi:hypothetical protein
LLLWVVQHSPPWLVCVHVVLIVVLIVQHIKVVHIDHTHRSMLMINNLMHRLIG